MIAHMLTIANQDIITSEKSTAAITVNEALADVKSTAASLLPTQVTTFIRSVISAGRSGRFQCYFQPGALCFVLVPRAARYPSTVEHVQVAQSSCGRLAILRRVLRNERCLRARSCQTPGTRAIAYAGPRAREPAHYDRRSLCQTAS